MSTDKKKPAHREEDENEEEEESGPTGLTSTTKLNNHIKNRTKFYKSSGLTDRDLYAAYYEDFEDWRLQDWVRCSIDDVRILRATLRDHGLHVSVDPGTPISQHMMTARQKYRSVRWEESPREHGEETGGRSTRQHNPKQIGRAHV